VDSRTSGPARAWTKAPARARSARTALGLISIFLIVGGTLAATAILVLLYLVWFGEGPTPDGAGAHPLWRFLVVRRWISQAVTVSSAVIRIILAVQAFIITSLLSAIILERYGVPLVHLAEFSVLRSVNSGPFKLVMLMVSSRRFLWRVRLPFALTMVIMVTALTSQFASTMLISDLEISPVTMDRQTSPIGSFLNFSNARFDHPPALTNAPYFIPFGEVGGGIAAAAPNDKGVSDTGVVQRVFLPFQETNRTTVREYRGKAYVLSYQYTCMRPRLLNARLTLTNDTTINPTRLKGKFVLSGNASFADTFRGAGLEEPPDCAGFSCFDPEFNCSMPVVPVDGTSDTKLAQACTPTRTNVLWTNLAPTLPSRPILNSTAVFYLIQSNATHGFINNGSRTAVLTFPNASRSDGEFATWRLAGGLDVSMSVCFQHLSPGFADVVAAADRDLPALQSTWDLDQQVWDVGDAALQLGVDPGYRGPRDEAAARGLYRVQSIGNYTFPDYFQLLDEALTFFGTVNTVPINLILSPEAIGPLSTSVNLETQTIVSQALRTTGRASAALQTLMTVFALGNIQPILPLLTAQDTAVVSMTTPLLAPRGSRGLVILTAIVCSSLVCSILITVYFLVRTRYSTHGNYWRSVAQVFSEETQWILDDSTEVNDDAVAAMMHGQTDLDVKIGRSFDGSGRVQVVPYRRTGK